MTTQTKQEIIITDDVIDQIKGVYDPQSDSLSIVRKNKGILPGHIPMTSVIVLSEPQARALFVFASQYFKGW